MTISINNVVSSTYIFIAILSVAFLISLRKRKKEEAFSENVSQELKGLAILAIVFSHIGYFLATDQRFLFPLSITAGVGVNLFLLLSGFGVTMSSLRKNLSIKQFYQRRLLKLLVPFWLVIGPLFLLDFFVLGKNYGWNYIVSSFLGLFTHANLYTDLNSPLWYFTFILFYYLLFPLVFRKKYYWLSALVVYFISYTVVKLEPAYFINVLHLYRVHLLAFPLGMALAGLYFNREKIEWVTGAIREKLLHNLIIRKVVYYFFLASLLFVVGYFAYYSNLGGKLWKEEWTSLLVCFALLGFFLLKKIDFKIFSLFGFYSYEIYLMHWPIMYRYDFLYRSVPAWLATALYLVLFLGLGWVLKKVVKIIFPSH